MLVLGACLPAGLPTGCCVKTAHAKKTLIPSVLRGIECQNRVRVFFFFCISRHADGNVVGMEGK